MKQIALPKIRNIRLWAVGVFLVAVGGVSWVVSPTVGAEANGDIGWIRTAWQDPGSGGLTQYSPNSNFLRIYDNRGSFWSSQWEQNQTTNRNGYEHLLKNEASSLVTMIRLYVYARSNTPPNDVNVTIRVDPNYRCEFSAPNSYLAGSGGQWLSIRKGRNLANMQELNGTARGVRATAPNSTNACNYAERGTDNPIELNSSDFTKDATTGLQRAIIDLRLTNGNGALIGAGDPPIPGWTGTTRNGVRFQTRASSESSGVFIGLPGRALERQFGIVEGADSGNAGYGLKAAFPFGVPCNEDDSVLRNERIQVYDTDPNTFGLMNVFVLKRPVGGDISTIERLSRNEYGSWTNFQFIESNGWFQNTNSQGDPVPNNETSSFTIRAMRKDHQYLLVILHPNRPNYPGSPLGNVLSMRLPSDSATGVVDCDYELTPSVQPISPTFEGSRPDFPVTGRIEVAGNDTEDHDWRLTARVYDDEPTNKNGADNTDEPCDWRGGSNCQALADGTRNGGFNDTFSVTRNPRDAFSNLDPGQWICFIMSVKKPSKDSDNGVWRHSNMVCSTPGTQPKVQVWGYDARLSGRAVTSTNVRDGRTLGSWSEYGAFSSGINHQFASSSVLNGGVNGQPADSALHELTFANTSQGGPGDTYGRYGELAYPSGLVDALWRRCGSNIPENRQIGSAGLYPPGSVVCATGRIVINDDFSNEDGETGNLNSLKQTIFIARDIVIGERVRNIDAWLIARSDNTGGGRISTCNAARDGNNYFPSFTDSGFYLTQNTCQNRLRVNGPVIADSMYLFRTSSSGDDGNPAERFNLRADAFLWAYSGGGSATAHTVSVKELPPRF